MLLSIAGSVGAEPPNAEASRPTYTAADFALLTGRLSRLEFEDAIVRQKLEELRLDPRRFRAMIEELPPSMRPALPKPPPSSVPPANAFRPEPPPSAPQESPKPPGSVREAETPEPRSSLPRPPSKFGSALDPRLRNHRTFRNALRFIERAIGPLEKSPAVKSAITEFLNSSITSEDSAGTDWNALTDPTTPLGREVAQWLESAANGPSWIWPNSGGEIPKVGLPEGGGLMSNLATPPAFSVGKSDASLLSPLAIFLMAGLSIALLRRCGWPIRRLNDGVARPLRRVVRPEEVIDRASLIEAFESLSLRVLGEDAVAWNHWAIAAEFRARSAAADAFVSAGHYELARYGPPAEGLARDWIDDARGCLLALQKAVVR